MFDINKIVKFAQIYDEKSRMRLSDSNIIVDKSRLKVANIDKRVNNVNIEFNFCLENDFYIFFNGYQSWTDSFEYMNNDKMLGDERLIYSIIDNKYKFSQYGDYNFYKYTNKKGDLHGYSYCYIRKKDSSRISFIGSLDEINGFTIFKYENSKKRFTITRDMYGSDKPIDKIFDLVFLEGDIDNVFDEYFELINTKKINKQIKVGWTSWYNYYQNISENIILDNLYNFKKNNIKLDYFQIDDGYQNFVGDWLDLQIGFQDMKRITSEIEKCGYKPGIWIAPFLCEEKSLVYNERNHFVLKDNFEEEVIAGSNWSTSYVLDIFRKDVQAYLKNVFDVIINEWGFKLLKLDFLYCVSLIPQRGLNRAQVLRKALDFILEITNNKVELLGCGVPLIPSIGALDYCRIGCDVDLKWDNYLNKRILHRERISTYNNIKNSIFRNHLNYRIFTNDSDVFLLRKENIKMNNNEKDTLFLVNNIFGALLFTSDDISKYDDKTLTQYKSMFPVKQKENLSFFHEDDLFIITFKIGLLEYFALINLSDKKKKYKLEKSLYFSKKYGFMEGNSEIILDKHTSVLFLKSDLEKINNFQVIGSNGSLFYGSEVDTIEITNAGVKLKINDNLINNPDIFLFYKGEMKTILVNGKECNIEKYNFGNVINYIDV